jgi:hypothetical protein
MFVIAKVGVYAHHVPGVFATLGSALETAASMARGDGRRPVRGSDGYHEWEIWECEPDGASDLRFTVRYERKGHWGHDPAIPDCSCWKAEHRIWLPATGLGLYRGDELVRLLGD